MRLRRKKQLDQRLDACGKYIAAREENFYDLPAEQRSFTLNLRQLFGNDNPVVLEIGCGKGGFAIKCAAQFEKYNFLAVEKLSNVIVAAGCVVTKGMVLESGWVYAGIPAKKIKQAGAELLQGEVERIVNSYAMYASWYADSENVDLQTGQS